MTYRCTDMVDSRKIHLILCLPGIFCSNLFFGESVWEKSHWQPWIWHLFSSRLVVYLGLHLQMWEMFCAFV